jgi:hypothetical protein
LTNWAAIHSRRLRQIENQLVESSAHLTRLVKKRLTATTQNAMSLREFTIKPPRAKNSAVQIQQQQPRNIQRVDVAPSKGYALVVDGHFKTQYEVEAAARKAAADLLGL